jgi:hypothetical protein
MLAGESADGMIEALAGASTGGMPAGATADGMIDALAGTMAGMGAGALVSMRADGTGIMDGLSGSPCAGVYPGAAWGSIDICIGWGATAGMYPDGVWAFVPADICTGWGTAAGAYPGKVWGLVPADICMGCGTAAAGT